MIVAITGGRGFIGKRLVDKHIKNGDHVRVLSRKIRPKQVGVEYFHGNLSNPDVELSRFVDGANVLYHCAGEINNKFLMLELHVNGTQRLINAAQGKIRRWVQLSTVGAYGACRIGTITEDSNEKPLGVYERTKTDSDNIVKNSNIPYVILRPSNVFGEDMPNQSFRQLLHQVRKGFFFFIGKENKFLVNYVHVEDVVDALMLCSCEDKALGQVFILSQSTTLENMITSFISESASYKKFLRVPECLVRVIVAICQYIPGFPLTSSRVDALTNKCVYNSTKIQKKLGFKYPMTLEARVKLFTKSF